MKKEEKMEKENESKWCTYCNCELPEGHEDQVPLVNDDEAWEELAKYHSDNCEWIESRAHGIQIETKIEIQFEGYQALTVESFQEAANLFEGDVSADDVAGFFMGDADCNGWISGELAGEDFQIRFIYNKNI